MTEADRLHAENENDAPRAASMGTWCCGEHVHFDLLDAAGEIFATACLSVEHFQQLAANVEDCLAEPDEETLQ